MAGDEADKGNVLLSAHSKRPSGEERLLACFRSRKFIEFYVALAAAYPNSRILAITPIWRKDVDRKTDFPSFDTVEKTIREATKPYGNISVIRGFDLVPHDEKYFADGYLHPNDAGFKIYAENLEKAILLSKQQEK